MKPLFSKNQFAVGAVTLFVLSLCFANTAFASTLTASCSASPASPAVGDQVTWTASASGGTSPYTYSWSGTDSLSGTLASITKVYSTAGKKDATVVVTSGSTTAGVIDTAHYNQVCSGTYTGYSTPEDNSGQGPGIITNHWLQHPGTEAYQNAPPDFSTNRQNYCVELDQTSQVCPRYGGVCIPNVSWAFRWHTGSGVEAPTFHDNLASSYQYESWTFSPNTTVPVSATASCSVTIPASSCTLPWGGTLANGDSVTAYQSSSVTYPAACVSETRTCSNGTLSGSYTNQSCTVAYLGPTSSPSVPSPVPNATAPQVTLTSTNANYCVVAVDWSQIAAGYFNSGTYPGPSNLSPGTHEAETYCYNSIWTGQAAWGTQAFTITPPPTASVSVPNNPVPYGTSPSLVVSSTNAGYCALRVDWSAASMPGDWTFTSGTFSGPSNLSAGSHEAEVYCYNPTWTSGSGWQTRSFSVTTAPVPGSCGTANGKTYAYGSSSYGSNTQCSSGSSSNTAFPSAGSSVSWTCSGSGGASGTCSASQNSPASCTLPWGGTLANGDSVTAYQSSSVTYPAACVSETRTCSNGTLSGSYTNQSCTVAYLGPTSSPSVPSPVPNATAPQVTLTSTNANYCVVAVDWSQIAAGYFNSGTYPGPSNLSPGTHEAETYCYNSIWTGQAAWGTQSFIVGYPTLSGSCSVSPSSGFIGTSFTWSTSGISGGTGSYSYAWSGSESLSGSGASVQKTYSSTGTKTGSVTITSGASSIPVSCLNSAGVGSVTVTGCYGQGCSGGGCSYPGISQPSSNQAQCCSPSAGVCAALPTATLSADSYDVDVGHATTLRWSCANAASYSGNGPIGNGSWPGTSNVSTGNLNTVGPQPYQITCSGAGGTSPVATATVTVHAPTAVIGASPARVGSAPNNKTQLTWAGTDVSSCTVSGPGLSVSGSSNASRSFTKSSPSTVAITAQSVYVITCQTPGGSTVTNSVTVNIIPGFTEF